ALLISLCRRTPSHCRPPPTRRSSDLQLLEASKRVDLTQVKTSISISKWIKLRLGDTLRVVIYHNRRHIVQALKLVPSVPSGTKTDRKSTRLNSSHVKISYAVFCLKNK